MPERVLCGIVISVALNIVRNSRVNGKNIYDLEAEVIFFKIYGSLLPMSVAGAKSKTLSPRNNIHSCALIYVCGFIAFIFFYFCLREAIVETVAECFVVDGKNRQHHTTDYQESDLTFKFGRFLQAHHGGVERTNCHENCVDE
ncbi:hypothetical protein GQX74_002765 [Glossina fuscipes]|nr:hypothetical protein GQX74_002765 [Glossina fuscipes]